MVKPGGTGTPARDMPARPAPLPPSRSFMVPSPSALPLPKKYTYFFAMTECSFGNVGNCAGRGGPGMKKTGGPSPGSPTSFSSEDFTTPQARRQRAEGSDAGVVLAGGRGVLG